MSSLVIALHPPRKFGMPEPPRVTGLSPKEGPPGARVTIRGENLGQNAKDLKGLTICGVNCLGTAEWIAPSKIICRVGLGKGRGDVIVTTMSGGVGESTVQYTYHEIRIGPLQECAVWVEEFNQTSLTNNSDGGGEPVEAMFKHDDLLSLWAEDKVPDKFPEEQLWDMLPEGSGNPLEFSFLPEWYLIENYYTNNFKDLKKGCEYMKMNLAKQPVGPISFVKRNLNTFLECQDALTSLYSNIEADEHHHSSGTITEELEELITSMNCQGDQLFEAVLGRKDRADATRNALNVLNRFKFLFNLPCNIERNIKKGDYEIVINDFERAKSLFFDTEEPIFRRVYQEVEKRIEMFKIMLKDKLLEFPSTIDEQKKLIRHLVELEGDSDPAWLCLTKQQEWICSLLIECKNRYLTRSLNTDMEILITSCPSPTAPTDTDYIDWAEDTTPLSVSYLQDLVNIITENFSNMWKLGAAYQRGTILTESSEKKLKVGTDNLMKFRQLTTQILDTLCRLVRAVFLPTSLSHLDAETRNHFGVWTDMNQKFATGWLPHVVRTFRYCLMSFKDLDISTDMLASVCDLSLELRKHCIRTMLKQAVHDIRILSRRETWTLQSYNHTSITALNIVNEVIQLLGEVVMKTQPTEAEIFSQQRFCNEVRNLCSEFFKAYSDCIENLVFKCDRENEEISESFINNKNLPAPEERVIIAMSNCMFTQSAILPRILDMLDKHGYTDNADINKISNTIFTELNEKLFESYSDQIGDPLIGALEQGVYTGNFSWSTCPPSKGVRPYVKEALMTMIGIHAEVYAIAPVFCDRILSKVNEGLAEEINRLIQCVDNFSANGAMQARLELLSLEDSLGSYQTDLSTKYYTEALNFLPSISKADEKKRLENLISDFKSDMKFLLECFNVINISPA